MTILFSATSFGDTATQPLVQLAITGLTDGDVISVTRTAPNEGALEVRGAVNHVVVGTAYTFVDPVPPTGILLSYALTVNGSYESSATVILTDATSSLLTDLATGEGCEVEIVRTDDTRTYAARANYLQPVGADYAVALYDTRSSATGTLTLVTGDRNGTKALEAMLAHGRPIAVRAKPGSLDIDSVFYAYPGNVSNTRITREGGRSWSLPYSEISLPDPATETVVVTLQDIDDYYNGTGTLSDINTDFSTLYAIAVADFGAV